MLASGAVLDFAAEFARTRDRTERIYRLLVPGAYTARPIPLRHPFVFYHGHLPGFAWIKLCVETLGEPPFEPAFDALFGRGIDPETAGQAPEMASWPDRPAVEAYHARIWKRLVAVAADPGRLAPYHLLMALEHFWMHHETLMYMVAELGNDQKQFGPDARPADTSGAPAGAMVRVPAGPVRLGARPGEQVFGWDNEYEAHTAQVDALEMDACKVTNGDYLEFVASGSAPGIPHTWIRVEHGAWSLRTVLGEMPLPLSWPVQVTQREALAYCRWAGKDLPTEAEWTRAAYGGDPGRPYPWGHEAPGPQHGNFGWQHWTWTRVGSYPAGASPFGVHDMVGNGWEWTSTPFAPFPGFEPMALYPRYSVDFFDGKHFVAKGASNFTDAGLVRRPFRNWFYGHYPYAHASFRGVKR